MERITKRIDEKHACYLVCEKECPDGITRDNPACVCSASRQAMEKLLYYEDLEEQGKLLDNKKYERFTVGMKVIRDGNDESDYLRCPHCKTEIMRNDDFFEKPKHCSDCGTKLLY